MPTQDKTITACSITIGNGMAWSTPIDRLFSQKVLFYAFVGIIVGTTALTLLSDSPVGKTHVTQEPLFDPKSQDPEKWSVSDLKRWLQQRGIHFELTELKDDLVKRVKETINAAKRRQEAVSDNAQGSNTTTTTEEGIELDELGKGKAVAT